MSRAALADRGSTMTPEGIVPHQDLLDTTGASVGYNLRNRMRMALNYEFQRRRSPALHRARFRPPPSLFLVAVRTVIMPHALLLLVALTAGQSAAVTASATPAPPPSQVI